MTEETRDSSLGEEAVENQGSLEPTPQSNEVIPATFPEQETGPWSQRSNRGTTPWSDPMHQIAVGLILSGLSFRILYLQYLLPLIGVLFLYFGLRQLREENLYFKRASIIVIIRLFLILTGALVGPLDFDGSKFMAVSALVGLLALVQLVLAIMLPWSLHKAVEEVYGRATQVPPRKPFRDSLIFFVFLIPALLALFLNPLLGVVTLLTLLVWGIQILYSMYRLGTQMDELPFGCTPAPVKMKMAHFSVLYSVLFVFLLLFSGVSSARLPLDPWAYIPTGMDESRQALVEAGMPEHIALDLEEQEVSRFLEAEKIIVSKNQF